MADDVNAAAPQQRRERRSCVAFTVGKLIVTRLSDTQRYNRDTRHGVRFILYLCGCVAGGGQFMASADVPGGGTGFGGGPSTA